MSIIAAGEVKTYLGLTDSSLDTVLTSLYIPAAQALIEGYLGPIEAGITRSAKIYKREMIRTRDGFYFYIDAVNLLTVETIDENSIAVDTDYYITNGRKVTVISNNDVLDDELEIAIVEYTNGWTSSNLPSDLKIALMILVETLMDKQMGVNGSITSEETGPHKVTYSKEYLLALYADGIPPNVKTILDRYKIYPSSIM